MGAVRSIRLRSVDKEADSHRDLGADTRLTMTVAEAATVLGLSQSATYEAIARGEIPAVKIGRRVLVKRRELLSILAS